MWSVVALIAGAVFGLGAYLANQEGSKLKYFGMNLLPAVFTAEGLDNVIHIEDYSHMVPAVIMKIIIGVILYLVVNRKEIKLAYLIQRIGTEYLKNRRYKGFRHIEHDRKPFSFGDNFHLCKE